MHVNPPLYMQAHVYSLYINIHQPIMNDAFNIFSIVILDHLEGL